MIIDTKQYNFSEWDSKRRERALHIMDKHVKKYCQPSTYDYWSWHSVGSEDKKPEQIASEYKEYSEDESKFIQALWAFYISMTAKDEYAWSSDIAKAFTK